MIEADVYKGYEPMTGNRPIILVDLDRTLLDTTAYTAELWDQVAALKPGVDAKQEMQVVTKGGFYLPLGTTHTQGAYSLEAHLKDLLDRRHEPSGELAVKTILGQVQENFPDATGFLHENAAELLEQLGTVGDVSIITFGVEADQAAKLRRLPTLADTPAMIIQEDKGTYIRDNYPESAEIWLIDDKPYANLPPNCQPVIIDHKARPDGERSETSAVNNLDAARQRIIDHYEETN